MSLRTLIQPLRSSWAQAQNLAEQTPESRNRYVDFLRALSILAVVLGHWLMSGASTANGSVEFGNLLAIQSWTHRLTLVFQVMPIFFFVGGYANGVAWEAALRKGVPYGQWLSGRLQRLLSPALPLLAAWLVLTLAAVALGADPAQVGAASQAALVPTWFLAVYVMVAVAVPLSFAAWRRHGWLSVASLVAGAVVVDAVGIRADSSAIRTFNYAFVWLAVHQLGYAWRDGRLGGVRRSLVWMAAGMGVTAALVAIFPYPLSMVSVPGQAISNSAPPSLALLAFGVAQISLALLLEAPARRWLAGRRVWASVVLVNGQIMTLYLWHMTALVMLLALAVAAGGIGLGPVIGSGEWWAARPLWLGCSLVTTLPFLIGLARFERPRADAPWVSKRRLVAGACLACVGLFTLAKTGVAGAAPTGASLRLVPVLLPFVGSGLAAFGPLGGLLSRGARRGA